jgi:cell wall-associated NlpC family hydrolase
MHRPLVLDFMDVSHYSLLMRTVLTFLSLLLAGAAHAAPAGAPETIAPTSEPAGSGDEIGAFLSERGLLARIGDVTQKVESKASELVLYAMAFLGVPYKRGGNTFETGFDCSGFVRAVYEQTAGKILPRRAEQQAVATQPIDRADLQPGDLVFFNTLRRTFSHVGIYIGDGKFIHSPKPGAQVRVENMGVAYWKHRFDGARRVAMEQPTTPNP